MPELSKAEKEFLLKKQAHATQLRSEFQKQYTNPFRHATMEGGTVFDAGMQRFQAMRVNRYDHFKPSGKSFRTAMTICIIPIALYAWWMKDERDGREHLYRTGQVAYKDRQFKFI